MTYAWWNPIVWLAFFGMVALLGLSLARFRRQYGPLVDRSLWEASSPTPMSDAPDAQTRQCRPMATHADSSPTGALADEPLVSQPSPARCAESSERRCWKKSVRDRQTKADRQAIPSIDGQHGHGQVDELRFGKLTAGFLVNLVRYVTRLDVGDRLSPPQARSFTGSKPRCFFPGRQSRQSIL